MDSDGPRRSSRILGKSIRPVKKQRRPTKRTVPRPAGKGSNRKVRSGPKIRQRKVKEQSYGRTTLPSKSILSVFPVALATPTGGQVKTTTGKGIARTKIRTGNAMGRLAAKSSSGKGPRSKRCRKGKKPLYGNPHSTLSSRSIFSTCTTPTVPTWPDMVIKTRGDVPLQVPTQVPRLAPPNPPALVAPGLEQASTLDPSPGDAQGPQRGDAQTGDAQDGQPHLQRPAAPSNHQAAPFVPNRDNLDQQHELAPVQEPLHLQAIQESPEAPMNPQAAAPEPDQDQDDPTEPRPEPESEPGSVSRRPWYQFR